MLIITVILCVVYIAILTYFIIGWNRIKEFNPENAKSQIKVSIIVPARNEENNIKSTLNDLIGQNYPKELFEIIIIDDNSTDNTYKIAEEFINEYADNSSDIQLLNLGKIQDKNFYAFKKRAIETGIKHSKNEWIITADADCRRDKKWLYTLLSFIEQNDPYFISAPVNFHKEKTFFEKMQSLEFLSLIGIGAATIGHGTPTMCNGANLGFRKDIYYEVGGYSGVDQIASGDDEFLLHKIAKKYPDKIGFVKNKEAIVSTKAFSKMKDFFQQRKRWVSKSRKYKNPIESSLQLLVYLFHLLILINGILSIIDIRYFYFFLILLAVKFISELIFVYPIANYFSKSKFMIYYLPSAILYVFYVVFIGVYGNIGRYSWKGRKVK